MTADELLAQLLRARWLPFPGASRPAAMDEKPAESLRTDTGRHRLFVVPAVAFLHFALLWVLAVSLRPPIVSAPGKELTAVFYRSPAAAAPDPPAPAFPDLPIVPPPDFVIEDDSSLVAPAAAPGALVLAPRPDPTRPNDMPDGIEKADPAAIVTIMLKIMVLPDGTIGDASVVRSSGDENADANAVAFVKARWHFLPALLNGNPIQYWTTVSVAMARAE